MIQPRSTIKNFFKRKNKPSEEQFADMLDSFAHLAEDAASLGVGAHNPQALYMPNAIIIHEGQFWKSKELQQGSFDIAKWQPAFSAGTSILSSNTVIAENHQLIVHNEYTIEDDLTIDGELIVMN
jgi:hypothetical protein